LQLSGRQQKKKKKPWKKTERFLLPHREPPPPPPIRFFPSSRQPGAWLLSLHTSLPFSAPLFTHLLNQPPSHPRVRLSLSPPKPTPFCCRASSLSSSSPTVSHLHFRPDEPASLFPLHRLSPLSRSSPSAAASPTDAERSAFSLQQRPQICPPAAAPHTAAPTDPAPFPTETDDQPTLFPPPAPPARHDRSTIASSFPVAGSYLKQSRGNQKKKERNKERKQK